jgi:hypothetical protein
MHASIMRLWKSYTQSQSRQMYARGSCTSNHFLSSDDHSRLHHSSRCYSSVTIDSKLWRSGVNCMGGAGMTSRPPSPMATRPIATRYVQTLTSTTPPVCRRSRTILHHSLIYYSPIDWTFWNKIVLLPAAAIQVQPGSKHSDIVMHSSIGREGASSPGPTHFSPMQMSMGITLMQY